VCEGPPWEFATSICLTRFAIDADIAKAALAAGNKVVTTDRKPESVSKALGTSDNLRATTLDVTRPEQIQAAVQAAIERWGRIDALVNNAG
jgi:NADP-dependent 3-hydroxy acid dehydrogenase YdfG